MARGRGTAQALADGIMGYVKGVQLQNNIERDDRIDKRSQESHDIVMRKDAQDQDVLRQSKAAALPAEVVQGAGGMTLPETADNRDVGQPDGPGIATGGLGGAYRVGAKSYAMAEDANKAATDYNSPDAMRARKVAVLSAAGRDAEAQQLETAGVQSKAAKFELERHEHDFINQKLDERLGQVGTVQELAEHASSITGKPVTAVLSEDGKKAQLAYTNDKGEQVKYGKEFDNSAEGVSREAIGYSKSMKVGEKITALQALRAFDENKRQFEEKQATDKDQFGKKMEQDATQFDARLKQADRHHAGSMGVQNAQIKLATDKFEWDKLTDPMNMLPPATKTVVAGYQGTVKAADAAMFKAQSENTWDPNSVNARDIMDRRDTAQREINKLMKPYIGLKPGEKPGAAAAPAGGGVQAGRAILTGGAPGAKPEPGSGPAQAAARPGAVTSVAQATPQPAPQAAPQPVAAAAPAGPAAALAAISDPAKDAAIETELQRATAERRAPQFDGPLRDYVARTQPLREQVAELQRREFEAQQAASRAQQLAEQDRIRASQGGRTR